RVGAAARDLDQQPPVGGDVELVAAVAPRDVEPVEAGPQELLVQLLRVVRPLLALCLLLDEPRAECDGAGDQLVRRQPGLRWRNGRHGRPNRTRGLVVYPPASTLAKEGAMTAIEAVRSELGASFEGRLIGPDDASFDEERALFNAMIDKRPA